MIKNIALFTICLLSQAFLRAQNNPAADTSLLTFRGEATKMNDLVHTKLNVSFDYAKHHLLGAEWVTVEPHFYPTDSLTLDAKSMDIKQVALMTGTASSEPLKFAYAHNRLKINLGKTFTKDQNYTVYIEYVAKPDEVEQKGSAAINSAKGLYFINSDGAVPDKPVQVWTQGETESSSCWFPTIDKPNQKTTDEISMTVPGKYVTLSNGRLASQKKNADGTRTDTWKMELPHAPYLFMMAVGDFTIYKDHWKDKEVNYYLEKKYAPYAKQIFGNTPEMMSYYADITGIDFPWVKYSQIVVRDYVSGAMENTTATLHGEYVQKTPRELLDGNEETTISICHELFHQWFGDYATCESWSNITMNESFATLSEILWMGHKYGTDAGDEQRYDKLQTYLNTYPDGHSPDLVRFHYHDREDVFDQISYPKGSVILYALKDLVGDKAFFAALNLYLKTNAFKATEAQQLRLAFEQVTGRDLNWYWNQWYYHGGHPILDVTTTYTGGMLTLHITQQQSADIGVFTLPVSVGVYANGKKEHHAITLNARDQVFSFSVASKPSLVDFDENKVIAGKVTHHLTLSEKIFAYRNAPSYQNRRQAIQSCLESPSEKSARELLLAAMSDPFWNLRKQSIDGLTIASAEDLAFYKNKLVTIAQSDPYTVVRASAINALSKSGDRAYLSVYEKGMNSQSYSVLGSSIFAISALDSARGGKLLMNQDSDTRVHIIIANARMYATTGNDAGSVLFSGIFAGSDLAMKLKYIRSYIQFLAVNANPKVTDQGIRDIHNFLQAFANPQANQAIAGAFHGISEQKKTKALQVTDAKMKTSLSIQAEKFEKESVALSKS